MRNDKIRQTLFVLVLAPMLLFNGCTHRNVKQELTSHNKTTDDDRQENFASRYTGSDAVKKITPHDYISMTEIDMEDKKNRTIMIYMNGSDLESLYAAATEDISEMAYSSFDEQNINIIIFTGGAKKWHTNGIPNNANAIFKLEKGAITKLCDVGNASTGDPEVLSGFINFCHGLFPADKYGLVFWNHGGGAVIGYGSDERYEKDPSKALMKLSEIDSALASVNLPVRLEFIGFDTCLMATVEMACIASEYADYLIASEELEPEQGWDYTFLGNITPNSTGEEIGRLVIDYFADFYEGLQLQDITTLSLTDLSKISRLSEAFESLALSAGDALGKGNYNTISHARSRSRAFGSGSQGGETDMIDLAQLAQGLSALLPKETDVLISALEEAVIYKHESNVERLGGLSIYFPFSNKDDLDYYLETYKAIDELPNYTGFISDFCTVLMGAPMQNYRNIESRRQNNDAGGRQRLVLTPGQLENLSEIRFTTWKKKEGLDNGQQYYLQLGDSSRVFVNNDGVIDADFDETWTTISGYWACLYEIFSGEGQTRYAVPAMLNGKEANLIAIFDEKYPGGKIIGAVPTSDDIYNTLDKKMVQIRDGDKIKLLYYAKTFITDNEDENIHAAEKWFESREFTVNGDLELKKESATAGEYLFKYNLIDTQNNDYYTDFAA